MDDIPDFNNFYSFLTEASRDKTADIFIQKGWRGKKSAWGEWRLRNDWSELVLYETETNELFINGSVIFEPDNIVLIQSVFDSINCRYRFEFYDSEKNVLMEVCNS